MDNAQLYSHNEKDRNTIVEILKVTFPEVGISRFEAAEKFLEWHQVDKEAALKALVEDIRTMTQGDEYSYVHGVVDQALERALDKTPNLTIK